MKLKIEKSSKIGLSQSSSFDCLDGNDVISGKISDHYPVVHDGVFFWNIMKQCNLIRGGLSFNNGFGLVESDKNYIARLIMIAEVIAEAVDRDPSIEVICLCEGPIKPEHVEVLFHTLMSFPSMARFMMEEMFHKPKASGPNWGLLMLADAHYTVNKVRYDSIEDHPKLANRFQLWKLKHHGKEKYIALAHFPFAGDEHKTETINLSALGHEYCSLINTLMESYSNESLIFCADFNFNPHLISRWQDRALDKISNNNSILLTVESESSHKHVKTVTVDGVLLSLKEKQKYHSSQPEPELLSKLKSEYRFFRTHTKNLRDLAQRKHDKQFGLVPYHSLL